MGQPCAVLWDHGRSAGLGAALRPTQHFSQMVLGTSGHTVLEVPLFAAASFSTSQAWAVLGYLFLSVEYVLQTGGLMMKGSVSGS